MSSSRGIAAMAVAWMPLAHLTPTGLEPWGDGMARLVLQPTDLLLAVPCMAAFTAIGLLAALVGRLRPLPFHVFSSGMAIAVLTTVLLMPPAQPHPRWLGIGLQA
jgi:hypothetical protein